ncbi:MAG: hypothetical protein ABSH40_17960 [Bryobacteraceae bacterium]
MIFVLRFILEISFFNCPGKDYLAMKTDRHSTGASFSPAAETWLTAAPPTSPVLILASTVAIFRRLAARYGVPDA